MEIPESENQSSQCQTVTKYVCLICGKTYSNYLSYKRHIKIHLGNPTSHECPVCDKSFNESYTLKRHINLTHLGVKKYECAYCGGKYATKDNLVKHIRILHLTTPELKDEAIKCLLCECYFRNKIHLSAHMRKQHRNQGSQENNINEKQKKIVKRIPNQPRPDDSLAMVLEQSDENVHKEPDIHTSEIVMKNGRSHYKCDVCGIIQNKFSSLQRHMTVHEIIQKFKCPLCDDRFKYLSHLREHMKYRHVIKCKSNNNKMLWNLAKDLKNDIFVKIDDTKASNRKNINKRKKILPKNNYNNGNKKIQNQENYIHENTHPHEIINKLSMPILDEESVTLIPAAQQTEQKNIDSTMSVEIPLLQHNIIKNTNDIQIEVTQTSSKCEKLSLSKVQKLHTTVTERNHNSTMKDALLGQANVPLIEEVIINIPKCNAETFTNSTTPDQIDIGNTNDTIYPTGEGNLYSECEYLNKNILNVMGLCGIDAEPSSTQNSNTELSMAVITDSGNIMNESVTLHVEEPECVNNQITNLSSMKQIQDINTNIPISSKILYDQNSFKIAHNTHIERVEGFENFNIPVRSIIAEKPDHLTQMQSNSTLTSTSGFNADIDLNEYNIDVSFDLNELSMESNNANISLTDIVEVIYPQNEVHQNTISNCKHFLQTPEEKQITSDLRNIENETTAQIVSPSDFLIDKVIQNFNTLNYDEDIIKETQNNHRICTTPTETQHQVQNMSSIDIEKYFQQNMDESPEINSATMPSYYNPEINAAEKSVASVHEDTIEKLNINNSNCADIKDPFDLFYTNNTNTKFVSHEDINNVPFSPIIISNASNNLQINESFTHPNIIEQTESIVSDTTVQNIIDICENVNIIDKTKLYDLEFLEDTNYIENITNRGVEKNILQNHSTVLYDIGQTDDHFGMSESDFELAFNPKLIESNMPNNQCDITDNLQPTRQGNIASSFELSAKRTIADSIKESAISNSVSDSDALDNILKNCMAVSNKHEHKCNECPASFRRVWDLRRHETTHNPKLKYLCEVCGKCYSSKSAYDGHLKHHDSKKVICWVCGTLIYEVSFARHKCVSTYKYECPICKKKFRYGIGKKNHMLTHFEQGTLQQ